MQVFEALSDPTRRQIVERLGAAEASAGELGQAFPQSRPAISRHLRVLREAGLVRFRRDAQRRIYSLNPAPLEDLDRWLSRYRHFWSGRLDELEAHLAPRRTKS
jgi:DNA-binding transcriptional ArsR family regulator